MSDEEKPLDLRDKIAIEIFNGLVSCGKFNNEDIILVLRKEGSLKEGAEERMETWIRGCYKAADTFRKIRLSSFE